MSTGNNEVRKISSPSVEPNDLPHESMDTEVDLPTSNQSLISPVQSPSILSEIEPTVSPVNTVEALLVDSEDNEVMGKLIDVVENETADAHIHSVNDETQDKTLTENTDFSINENEVEANVNNTGTVEVTVNKASKKAKGDHTSEKISQFPLGRIKDIMKSDPDIKIVSAECVFLIAKSTELFLQRLGKEIHAVTLRNKKKTLQKRDLDAAISENPAFEFLEGALD